MKIWKKCAQDRILWESNNLYPESIYFLRIQERFYTFKTECQTTFKFSFSRMTKQVKKIVLLFALSIAQITICQTSNSDTLDASKKTQNNIFTSGLFMNKGKFEVKAFNNLYTETYLNSGVNYRGNYFTSFFQVTLGTNKNINFGIDLLYKSQISQDLSTSSPFDVFKFQKKSVNQTVNGSSFTTNYNHGLSHAGLRVRIKPFKNHKQFTLQQSVYLPTQFIENGVILNFDLFYEKIYAKRFLLFADLGVYYNLRQAPFPYFKIFTGTFIAKRFAPYVMLNVPYEVGVGTKFFITPKIEIEFLYTYWLPLEFIIQNRKPMTFNFGIRLTNFKNF